MGTKKAKKDEGDSSIYALFFTSNDDVKRLVLNLKNDKDPFGQYLLMQLSPDTKRFLLEYTNPNLPLPYNLLTNLLGDLNRIIHKQNIYEEADLSSYHLTSVTHDFARNIWKKDLAKLNQLIMAEIYPREIKHGLKKGTREWHCFQVEKYSLEKPYYETYCKVLRSIFKKACDIYAPMAIVEVREKSLSSFAEKIMRKDDENPAFSFTDLAGARVITETQNEVNEICRFIENNFDVDVENSLDALSRLKIGEFGYRSVHYIVRLKGEKILGEKVPPIIGDRKAEIQVRTLLQHTWASIYHDRLYKTELKIPEQIDRKIKRVSALLELCDLEFADVVRTIDSYTSNYSAYMKKKDILEKINTLKLLFNNERNHDARRKIAIKIALMSKVVGNWKDVIDYLGPFIKDECREKAQILSEHGNALCRYHGSDTISKDYQTGVTELRKALDFDDKNIRVQTLSNLAWAYGNLKEETLARKYCLEAFNEDPSNPYNLISYLECEMCYGNKPEFLPCIQHEFDKAIQTCRSHIDVGVELPHAYLTIGKLYLVMGQWYKSISSYLKAVQYCMDEDACIVDDLFQNELIFLKNINRGRDLTMEHEWIRNIILLGMYMKDREKNVKEEIDNISIRKKAFKEPVIIVEAGIDGGSADAENKFADSIICALSDFKGTVISRGIREGVSGLIGELYSKLNSKQKEELDVIAYLPESIPLDFTVDNRYKEFIKTKGTSFNASQPIQMWIDFLSNGVRPNNVRFLCVDGDELSALGCKISATFGATVGIVQPSKAIETSLLKNRDWNNHKNILWFPEDKMTIRPFINMGISKIDEQMIEKMGKAIHEKFLEENRYKTTDPTMLPWDLLDEGFKESNRQQAIYATEILRKCGYGVRKARANEEIKPIEFTNEELEMMSEMEHGRWIVERLKKGWRYSENRDPKNKLSPYLVSWGQLPDYVKDYDRNAIRKWPELFREAGLEIYKIK